MGIDVPHTDHLLTAQLLIPLELRKGVNSKRVKALPSTTVGTLVRRYGGIGYELADGSGFALDDDISLAMLAQTSSTLIDPVVLELREDDFFFESRAAQQKVVHEKRTH